MAWKRCLPTGSVQAGFVGLFVCLCLILLERVHCFEPVHEDEVGHLLDGLERVGETTAPELVPEGVDLGFKFGGEAYGERILIVIG